MYQKKNELGQDKEITEYLGTPMMVSNVMTEIEKDVIFYDESGGGVTFSGGEPLAQPDFLLSLLSECRKLDIHTALDTTGFSTNGDISKILGLVDLILFDLKLIHDDQHKRYTGVSNKLILSNLKRISDLNKDLVIRIPVIPGITDTSENLKGILSVLSGLSRVIRVDFLPFHKTGFSKHERLGLINRMADIQSPHEGDIERIKKQFEQHGHRVRIGG